MLDIGGWELLVIGVVALIVVGPRELPGLVRAVGRWVAKARNLAREFQSGMEAAAEEVDIEDFRKIGSVKSDLEKQVRDIGRSAQRMIDDDDEDRAPPRPATRSAEAAPRRTPAPERIEPGFDEERPRSTSRYAERREPPRDQYGADGYGRYGEDVPQDDEAARYRAERRRE